MPSAYRRAIQKWVKTGQLQHQQELLKTNKEVQQEGAFLSILNCTVLAISCVYRSYRGVATGNGGLEKGKNASEDKEGDSQSKRHEEVNSEKSSPSELEDKPEEDEQRDEGGELEEQDHEEEESCDDLQKRKEAETDPGTALSRSLHMTPS